MVSFVSEAPGRLCLFGEHQDYLGLPVIACALPLYCRIHVRLLAQQDTTTTITLRVPQLNQVREYNLQALPPRQSNLENNNSNGGEEPDFALAAIYEALDDGWQLQSSAECTSTAEFPMQAGISSSSAFCVAFCHVLAHLAGQPLDPLALAQRAHRAEVTHFHAPGGTMDHVTSAVGGLLRIGPGPWDVHPLLSARNDDKGVWVLAYSGEPKDTLRHLHRCKNARLALREKLGGTWDRTANNATLTHDEEQLLRATRTNRDMEQQAFDQWTTASGPTLGKWMQTHHEALRDGLHLSSAKLEALNVAAHDAGAWGFKVVGSGGGGCGVAWTSSALADAVAGAMKAAGATATWIVTAPSEGARLQIQSQKDSTS